MVSLKAFENYPCGTVIVSNLVSVGTYLAGGYIIYQFGIVWLTAYLLYVLFLEVRLMKKSCVNCYYYGKVCAFGRGKISSLLFKKGDLSKFGKRKITWKDVLPDFLVSMVPVLAGIGLLVVNFSWLVLSAVVVLVVLTSAGNGFVRGSLACKFCKQRELGCPAEKLFNKKH